MPDIGPAQDPLGLPPETAALVAEHVAASRAAQGLPRHIEDPVVLGAIAAVLDAPAATTQNSRAA